MSMVKKIVVRSLWFLLVFLFTGLPGSGAWAGSTKTDSEQLRKLSEEIKQAGKDARYQADQTVYEYLGDKVQTTRYRIQCAYPYRKKETIGGPNEARCIMLEDGKFLWSYFPAKKIVIKEPIKPSEHAIPADLPENLELLSRNYDIYMRGPVTVDSRLTCRILEFLPRKGDRPSREIWLEETRKLPIRVFMEASDGRPAYRTELKRIRWNPVFEDDTFQLKVPRDTKVFEIQKHQNLTVQKAEKLLNRSVALPLFTPEGYEPYDIVLRVEALKKRLQLIYSDGLSSYSVFQEWSCPKAGSETGSDELAEAETVTEAVTHGGIETSAEVDAVTKARKRSPVPNALAGSSPRIYHYGMITVVTQDQNGKRTVAVGDVPEGRLLDVIRSLSQKR